MIEMEIIMCTTCGTQYNSCSIPEKCLICNDERQYINPDGQSWTTLKRMVQQGDYKNSITFEESGLYSIKTIPKFAIGQTAYIIHQNNFRLLWDCISYLDKATIQEIKEMGGLNAIALSHPHYYSSQVEWAETFDIPIYIHMDDRSWVMRPSDQIIFWSGESIEVYPGLTLYRLGGHFKGASVLEWKDGNEGIGVLLTGDVIRAQRVSCFKYRKTIHNAMDEKWKRLLRLLASSPLTGYIMPSMALLKNKAN